MKRISPQFLQGSLAHVFVLESISTGLTRIRLAGSYLTDLMEKKCVAFRLRNFQTSLARKAVGRHPV
jgi:hypothetical protein